ncbi:hypothetical protein KGP26_00775 [Serratia sp. JSRIV002]|uniref:hypothetical protein n=1 Tax=Serratia sp. JSRIV002 TaxID=2831894 RepID=UPI001CBDB988|nr:hypothetical protein [Serratia sp. JSRIV002]UAN51663.1 hypothetical protein KGP26_00775 [Serratia sp. JSRIV002]
MKKIYLIDRQIISIIDKLNENKPLRDDQVAILTQLRKYDRKGSIFSPILAIMEGQSSRPENESEVLKTISEDIAKLVKNNFFKKAKVDQSLCNIPILRDLTVETLTTSARDIKRESYLSLLKIYHEQIGDPVGVEKRMKTARDMKLKADEFNISVEHPVFFTSLLCLFGSGKARDLLKFGKKSFTPYNSYSDIKLYSDYVRIIDFISKSGIDAKVKIISQDKGVNFLQKLYENLISAKLIEIAPLINYFEYKMSINTSSVSTEIIGKENRINFCKIHKELYNQDIFL